MPDKRVLLFLSSGELCLLAYKQTSSIKEQIKKLNIVLHILLQVFSNLVACASFLLMLSDSLRSMVSKHIYSALLFSKCL